MLFFFVFFWINYTGRARLLVGKVFIRNKWKYKLNYAL